MSPLFGSSRRSARSTSRDYRTTLVGALDPSSAAAEAYRMLRTNLLVGAPDARRLVVTSAGRGEGKSITSANLAVVLAQSDRSVVLVDADLRIPSAHQVFNLPENTRHIGHALHDPTDADHVAGCLHNVFAGLHVLASVDYAPRFPSEILGSRQFDELLDTLAAAFDYVIVDTAPVGLVTDAVVASQHADGVIFVIDHRASQRRFVERSLGELTKSGRRVLGTVLNRYPIGSDRYVLGGEYYRREDARVHRGPGVPPPPLPIDEVRQPAAAPDVDEPSFDPTTAPSRDEPVETRDEPLPAAAHERTVLEPSEPLTPPEPVVAPVAPDAEFAALDPDLVHETDSDTDSDSFSERKLRRSSRDFASWD